MSQDTNENLSEGLQVRRDKLSDLQEKGKDPFRITKYHVDNNSKNIEDHFEEYEEKMVSIAGRVMSKRGQGKVSFYDLQDSVGRIQMFLKKDTLGEEAYAEIKTLDIGDIVGVKGEAFKTKTGQISIRVKELTLLTKSLQVLPENFMD